MAQTSKMIENLFPSIPKVPTADNFPQTPNILNTLANKKEEKKKETSATRSKLMDNLFKTEQQTTDENNEPTQQTVSGSLGDMDVVTEMPKLTTNQIYKVLSTKFNGSKFSTPEFAQNIYNAQKSTGMSALAMLGIAALESGWGKSDIANAKNNLWGYGAVNSNPMGGAQSYSNGAMGFATNYMKDYYNGYGSHTINQTGTGNNPAGMGYAYTDGGAINPNWATSVTSLMNDIYNVAKGVQ